MSTPIVEQINEIIARALVKFLTGGLLDLSHSDAYSVVVRERTDLSCGQAGRPTVTAV